MKRIKNEKGAITLFVVISIIFFIIILVGLYVNSSNKIQKQEKELQQIQKSYEPQNIDEVYNSIAKNIDDYAIVSTFDELKNAINNNSIQYIILTNDITTNNYLIINRAVSIDLNGYSYVVENQTGEDPSIKITGVNVEVAIIDSSKNGTGAIITENTNSDKVLISIENSAKLNLEGGEFRNDNLNNRDTKIVYISQNSELTMKKSTIVGNIVQKGIANIVSGKIVGEIINEN